MIRLMVPIALTRTFMLISPVVYKRRVQAFAAKRTGQMSGVTQQETPPIAQAFDHALAHLERGDPAEIGAALHGASRRTEWGTKAR